MIKYEHKVIITKYEEGCDSLVRHLNEGWRIISASRGKDYIQYVLRNTIVDNSFAKEIDTALSDFIKMFGNNEETTTDSEIKVFEGDDKDDEQGTPKKS